MVVDCIGMAALLFTFWGKSRTKASFSHLQLSFFQGSLAQKLRFHIFNFHFFREVSHKSFVFTSSTSTFWRKSRTKTSFQHLQLSLWKVARRVLLCFATGCFKSHWSGCVQVALRCSWVRSSIVFCKWVFADRIVMAAWRCPGAVAACVILLSFVAGHGKSYWNGCV